MCLFKAKTWNFNVIFHSRFLCSVMLDERWLIIRWVDIGRIVDHHCLTLLFINQIKIELWYCCISQLNLMVIFARYNIAWISRSDLHSMIVLSVVPWRDQMIFWRTSDYVCLYQELWNLRRHSIKALHFENRFIHCSTISYIHQW